MIDCAGEMSDRTLQGYKGMGRTVVSDWNLDLEVEEQPWIFEYRLLRRCCPLQWADFALTASLVCYWTHGLKHWAEPVA